MHVAYQGFGDEAGTEGAAVAVLLEENMLLLYHHKPVPYTTEEEGQLPMAAED